MRYLRDIMKETCNFFVAVWAVVLTVLAPATSSGQILDPVSWDIALYPSVSGEANAYDLVFHAEVEPCWHIYSQFLESQDGPLPTWIDITLPAGMDSVGHARECEPLVAYDPNFMMDLQFFEEEVSWVQTLRIPSPSATDTISGFISFMVCDDSRCLPPEDIDFAMATTDVRPASERPEYCPPSQHLCDHGEDEAHEGEEASGILEPVTWDVQVYEDGDAYELVFHALVEPCWHTYSQHLESLDGPMPSAFRIDWPEGFVAIGDVEECAPLVQFDPTFEMEVKMFEEEVSFVQRFKAPAEATAAIQGAITFMACDDEKCIFPPDLDFSAAMTDRKKAADRPAYCPPLQHLCNTDGGAVGEGGPSADGDDATEKGLAGVFFLGMLLGFAALLTPCVFPMIPMTVSFFTKQSKTRSEGIRNALLYGFFIIFIYTGLGLLLTAVFGVDILNVISTDPFFNIFLFLLLLVFGASFLGAFEIQLPTSWANKTDQAADRGGIAGIFFMAATLAIVSFSCTGPLVGSALAGAATGSFAAPAAVMFGFSLALAIPFALFSAFPGWLNSLPQSGGWLNSVKVVLGLLEIGFAFKFLSNADLVLQLGLLQRELFIAIWVAVSLAIAFYLFGWLVFPHDSKTERIGVFRFSMGMLFFILGIYLVPGLWGAPVNLISGFPPPTFYSEWAGGSGGHGGESAGGHVEAMYTDYEEGLAAAREAGKPVLLDFTGWACVNCRKMEEQVWPDKEVSQILTQDVILVSLYVDERTDLPEAERRVETYGGKDFKIKTVGNKWSYMQAAQFNTNSQPFYVMVDHDGNQIGGTAGYDPDPEKFISFLKRGLKAFGGH